MLGGAPEVGARAAASGGDEAERCAAITVQAQRAKPSTAKSTKDQGALKRPGEQRTENGEQNARQARDGRGAVQRPSLQTSKLPNFH